PRLGGADPAGGKGAATAHGEARMNDENEPTHHHDPAPPMVRFDGVTKRYGDLTVLDRLDLDVAAHEKVAVIGPSGSGKTTVLRMLMTLEAIDDGVISVDGEPLTHME